MNDLKDFTMIFHFKFDSFTRVYNLNTILQYYYKNLPGAKIILIEEGKEPSKLINSSINLVNKTGGKHIFFKNDSEFYIRPRLFNIASTQTDSKYIATCDVDVILNPQNVIKGLSHIKEYNLGLFIAHNGSLIDVSNSLRDEFVVSDMDHRIFQKYIPNNLELSYRDQNIHVRCCPNTDWKNVSTFLIFDHDKYNYFKGYCNHFKNWSFEDLEIQERLKKLEIGIGMLSSKEAFCIHFSHPAVREIGNNHFKINEEILHRVRKMNKQEVLEFIKTWDFI